MTKRVGLFGYLAVGLLLLSGGDTGLAADRHLTGIWNGEYSYESNAGRDPVTFKLFFVDDGQHLTGAIMERNTFGEGNERWLHAALVDAVIDSESGELSFTKRYDGTDGVDHDVEYSGRLMEDSEIIAGKWQIPGSWGGRFRIARQDRTGVGPLSGAWSGTYAYPAGYVDANGLAPRPVEFWLVLIDDDESIRGYLVEPNTFGDPSARWLHASVKGQFDEESRELNFRKIYDGTGDVGHDVEYTGQVSVDSQSANGIWDIDGFRGTFQLERGGRHPLDAAGERDAPGAVR